MVLVLSPIHCLIVLLKDSPSRMINLMLLCCTWDRAIKHIEYVCHLCSSSTNQSQCKRKAVLCNTLCAFGLRGQIACFTIKLRLHLATLIYMNMKKTKGQEEILG